MYVLQPLSGLKTANLSPQERCAGSMTRSTSWYSAFPRCDLGEQLDYGVYKCVEFDFDFRLNIRYVPGALQPCAFSVLFSTGFLAGWIRVSDSSDCARLQCLSNGALTLEIQFVLVLLLAIYCSQSTSFSLIFPSGDLAHLWKPLKHSIYLLHMS